ncbi:hypothetical protein PFV29_002510 [Escherichia coli]|nr:hypothetical protein [Escherichia coli]EKI8156429.1 hypothetical protein [Escherichia coli]
MPGLQNEPSILFFMKTVFHFYGFVYTDGLCGNTEDSGFAQRWDQS